MIQVNFTDRSGKAWLPPDGLTFTVDRLSTHYQIGSKEATLTAQGALTDISALEQILRYGVEIYDSQGDLWQGYVSAVKIQRGAMTLGLSLDDMANKVAVAYSYIAPGDNTTGYRKTTTWVEDADSIATYGTKQLLVSASGLTDEAAEARRATELGLRKYPVSMPTFGAYGFLEGNALTTVTIECRGWFYTLDWKHYSEPTVNLVSWTTTSTATQNVGNSAASTKILQQFTPAQSVTALDVGVYVKKVGSPTDNLKVDIFALDASGIPTGTSLGGCTLAGSGLTTAFAWYENQDLSKDVDCLSGVMYGLVYSRSGSVDSSNHYQVNLVAAGGYAGGAAKAFDATPSAWADLTGDIPFKIGCNNKVETSEQIRDIVTDCEQFFEGIYVENASGIYSGSFRNGDTTALEEVIELMNTGTSNGLPYCGLVDKFRNVWIFEQPTTTAYLLTASGQVLTTSDEPIDPWRARAGVWYAIKDISSVSVTPVRVARIDRLFAETVEWNKGAKIPTIFPLGGDNPVSSLSSNLSSGLTMAKIQASTPQWVYLQKPLTSTSWDGDSFSSTAKTLIDLSVVFGVPAGVKAVLCDIALRDSGAGTTDCYLQLAPNNTANLGLEISPPPVADRWGRYSMVIPCNTDGDIYYQISATGSLTMDIHIQIWGYQI